MNRFGCPAGSVGYYREGGGRVPRYVSIMTMECKKKHGSSQIGLSSERNRRILWQKERESERRKERQKKR